MKAQLVKTFYLCAIERATGVQIVGIGSPLTELL